MKINLFDLPSEYMYIKFKEGKIFDEIKDVVELNRLSFPKYTFHRARRTKIIRLKYLKELATLSNIKEQPLEADIKYVFYRKDRKSSTKIYPKFPINFSSKDGARIISALLYDGGISSELVPFYTNVNTKMKELIKKAFQNLFGKGINIIENEEDLIFSKVIGIILVNCIGLKSGTRIKTNPGIPSFIFNESNRFKSTFLRQAFSDEGSSSRGHVIKFELQGYSDKPSRLLMDTQNLLHDFPIETSRFLEGSLYKRKDKTLTKGWYFTISHHTNLIKFIKYIGFDIDSKNAQLINYLSNMKQFPRMSKGRYEEYYFEKVKEIKKKIFCYKDLIPIFKCSKSTAQHTLKRLREKNLIQFVSKGRKNIYYYELSDDYTGFK